MTTAVTETNFETQPIRPHQPVEAGVKKCLLQDDLAKLSPEKRISYYLKVCRSLGLNPLTRPFEYLLLDGKLVLYARKDCTDQLRSIRQISVKLQVVERTEDVYVVKAMARDASGREDEATGVVALVEEDGEWQTANSGKRYFKKNGRVKKLVGDKLANAMMRAETKSKRRVTLSICGLGFLDESEVHAIPGAELLPAEAVESKQPAQLPAAASPAAADSQPSYRQPPQKPVDPTKGVDLMPWLHHLGSQLVRIGAIATADQVASSAISETRRVKTALAEVAVDAWPEDAVAFAVDEAKVFARYWRDRKKNEEEIPY
jgi:hypothetical protein